MSGLFAEKYNLLMALGKGGFATVYKALDTTLNREVALKILDQSLLSDEDMIKRFRREARAIAQLVHPNIIPIYEIAEFSGQHYIAMRYLPGGTLAERIAQQALLLENILRVTSQASAALDFAHEQGFVHRDIKPGNILFDALGNAILSDFGITKIVGYSEGLTQGAAIGTPYYMAPEQCRGEAVDGRTDIYSLSVMLYRMLAGRYPFEGAVHSVMYSHIHEEAPSPLSFNPSLPLTLESVFRKALAKKPDDRYQTARHLFEDVQAALTSLPTNLPTVVMDNDQVPAALGGNSELRSSTIPNTVQALLPKKFRGQKPFTPMRAFVLVIVEKDGHYLLIQEAKPERGNAWYLPAGRVEIGESIVEAAKRETLEESGLVIEPRHFVRIEHEIPQDQLEGNHKIERWRFIIVAEAVGGSLKTVSDQESLRAGWFRLDELKALSLRSYEVVDLIEAYRRGSRLWPIDGYLLRIY